MVHKKDNGLDYVVEHSRLKLCREPPGTTAFKVDISKYCMLTVENYLMQTHFNSLQIYKLNEHG